MAGPIIQTADLENTFRALRSKDPRYVERQNVPYHPDYKTVPNQNYAPTTSVQTGWGGGMTRTASASASGGIVYGQPQFFSPVHTPINWQIPSKRLEIYQWMFLPCTQVLREDFTYSDLENAPFICNNIIEDSLTGGFVFETSNYPKIMNSEGVFNQPPRISMRDCENKRCFSFEPLGNYRRVRISEEHHIYVLDGLLHRRNRKVIGGKKYRSKKGIVPNGVEKVKIQNKLIKRIQAHEVKRSDYLLTPLPQVGKISINKDMAWLIGFCVADGCIAVDGTAYSVNFTGCKDEKALIRCQEILEANFDSVISSKQHGGGKGWRVAVTTKKAHDFFRTYIVNKGIEKKFSKAVFDTDMETRLNILAGYFDGDGSFSKAEKKLIANCYSQDLADQIYWLLISCKIGSSLGRYPLYGEHYPTTSEFCYRVFISASQTSDISGRMNGDKVPTNYIPKKERELKFFYTEDEITYLAQPIDKIEEFLYTGKGFDIEMTNERKALVADGYVCSNSRFFYQNEPKVASAIDFYSYFPVNDYEHECKDRNVKKYFDRLKKRLGLVRWLRLLSHEVHLLGDCFPFTEIQCPTCDGVGRVGDEICEHDGGTIRRIVILNPDYVDVYTSPMNPEPVIAMRPDEELINMIQKRSPGYDRVTPEVRALIAAGKPIRLDNRSVSHIKYGECGYDRYGIGMVRRLFPILSYKTKLMVAQWIVAERLIIPIRIVKVGSDERPAGPADISAVQSQLAQTANDPNLTIVTHHAFELIWEGACYDDQTEVLTENGWKKYGDVSKNHDEKIATYNLNNDQIEFDVPVEYHEFDFKGEMCYFKAKHYDTCVTPNHNMLVQTRQWNPKENRYSHTEWTTTRADQVIENSRFKTTVGWHGNVPADLPYKNEYLLSALSLRDYLEFVGYYLSEGGLQRGEKNAISGEKAINCVHITQKEDSPYFESMKKSIYSISSSITDSEDRRSSPSCWQFRINDCKLAREIAKNYGDYSNSKHIPKWILDLPCSELKVLLDALIKGDGNFRSTKSGKERYKYTTVSKQLADAVQEIVLKMGYDPKIKTCIYKNPKHQKKYIIFWSEKIKEDNCRAVKDRNIFKQEYDGKVWCFTVKNGFFVTRRNGKIAIHGNSGKVLALSNEFEFINQEILDGLMINNALLNGEGPTFANASIGVEAMYERLDTFRKEIALWVEEKIYLPEAKRQGFIDEEYDGDDEDEKYIYPKIKWNRMNLRDQQQYRNFVLQLFEKGLLSAQTVLEAFDFDPDNEIEKKRYDALSALATAGPAGAGGMGGGFGGAPGGGGGGGGGGGDLGGLLGAGAPPGGGGEAPISAPPGGGGEMGGGAPAAGPTASESSRMVVVAQATDPSQYGGKILKPQTREKLDREREKIYKKKQTSPDGKGTVRDEKGRVIFTKCERQLIARLRQYQESGLIRYQIVPQFRVQYGSDQEFPIDFAIPNLKIGLEADGEIFHSSPKQVTHDHERDRKLAQLGWTILRFQDKEIEEKIEQVMSTVMKTIMHKEAALKQQVAGIKK